MYQKNRTIKILKLLIACAVVLTITSCFKRSSTNKDESTKNENVEEGLHGSFNVDGRIINVGDYYYGYKTDEGFFTYRDVHDDQGTLLLPNKNDKGYLFNYDTYLNQDRIYYSYIETLDGETIIHLYTMNIDGTGAKEITKFKREYDFGGYISFIYKDTLAYSTYDDLGEIPSFINLDDLTIQHAKNGYYFEGDIPLHHDYYENDFISPHHYNQYYVATGANGEASTTKAYLFDADQLKFDNLTSSVWDCYLLNHNVYTIEEVDDMYSIYAYNLKTNKRKELTQFTGSYGAGFYRVTEQTISYEIYSDVGDSSFYEYNINDNHTKSIVVDDEDDETSTETSQDEDD